MSNSIIGFEITVSDVRKMKSFYNKVLGWKFGMGPHKGVHSIKTGGKGGIKGTLLERGEYIPDYVSLYLEVPEIQKVVAKVRGSGGTIIRPPFSPDGKMEICIVQDPEGHIITLQARKPRKGPKVR